MIAGAAQLKGTILVMSALDGVMPPDARARPARQERRYRAGRGRVDQRQMPETRRPHPAVAISAPITARSIPQCSWDACVVVSATKGATFRQEHTSFVTALVDTAPELGSVQAVSFRWCFANAS